MFRTSAVHPAPQRRKRGLAALTAGVACVALSACGIAAAQSSAHDAAAPQANAKRNIVFVLTDDLSMNLLPYMPAVQQLAQDGATMTNYNVTDSLCCPSRSSIFTGKFPHDTGVFTNGGTDGGFDTFHGRDNEQNTFAVALKNAGYRTAMMGKYMNGYLPDATVDGQQNYVPPGWTDWAVAGNGYAEYNYTLNVNGHLEPHGSAPADYMVNVLSDKASTFITNSASAGSPFMLEVATFAPHGPYTPAPQDTDKFPGLQAPRGPAFDTLPTNPPSWLAGRAALTQQEKNTIDQGFRKRAQAVQSVDRMITRLRNTLVTAGVANNTVVVFSSDNGYHMGQYRLNPGKMTAFDTDINVPLVVAGPGIAAGRKVANPVENIDLAPTFERFGGVAPAAGVDGHGLVDLLTGQPTPDWRTGALVEHHGPDTDRSDPDFPAANSGNPTTYEALRAATYTYVEYTNGDREYYDRSTDPNELHNTAGSLPANRKAQLHDALTALQNCHGGDSCWAAGHQAP